MLIGIIQIHLYCAIRTIARLKRNRNIHRIQSRGRSPTVIHLEGVMKATRQIGGSQRSQTGRASFGTCQIHMNLSLSGLKPLPREAKVGSTHRLHSQNLNIEFGTAFEVRNDDRDMIDCFDADRHSLICRHNIGSPGAVRPKAGFCVSSSERSMRTVSDLVAPIFCARAWIPRGLGYGVFQKLPPTTSPPALIERACNTEKSVFSETNLELLSTRRKWHPPGW